jgi:transcription elongation GreA/GreB family factor
MSRALNLRHVNAHIRLRQHRREELVRLRHEEERELIRRIWDAERDAMRARTESRIMEGVIEQAEAEDRERTLLAAGPLARLEMAFDSTLTMALFFVVAGLCIALLASA